MNFIYVICIFLTASLMAAVLVSGKATINFNHNPKLDKLVEYRYYRYDYSGGTLNIYLTDTIKKRDGYLSLIQLIHQNKDKQVKLYLAGNGGRVNSSLNLYFTLKSHPKKVTAIVTSNVYSAHAFLAFAGGDLKVLNPNILFLFHKAAINKDGNALTPAQYCRTLKGYDRGISKKKKCLHMAKKAAHQNSITFMSSIFQVLTEQEIKDFYKGYDVIIDGATVLRRLK